MADVAVSVEVRTNSYDKEASQPADVAEISPVQEFKTATPKTRLPPVTNTNDNDAVELAAAAGPNKHAPYAKYAERLGWLWLFLSFWPLLYVIMMVVVCKRFRDWDRSGIDFGLFQLYTPNAESGVNTNFNELLALACIGMATWIGALILSICACCGCTTRRYASHTKVGTGTPGGGSHDTQHTDGKHTAMTYFRGFIFVIHVTMILFCTIVTVGPSWISVQHMKHSDNSPSSYASDTFQRIAIVGGGAAGTGAAMSFRQLPHRFNYTIYEAEPELGGHAYAPPFKYVDSKGKNATFNVDMGFIFGPTRTYRAMRAFLNRMGVERTMSRLSVSTTVGDDVTYATDDPNLLDANLARQFHKDIEGVDVESLWFQLKPFGVWLDTHGYDENFRQTYLTPLLSTLFITKTGLYAQSTAFMAAMFDENKWLDLYHAHPAWVVKGSTRVYYDALQAHLGGPEANGQILYSTTVSAVTRLGHEDPRGKIKITTAAGDVSYYDGVVMTCAANYAKEILQAGGTSNSYEQFSLRQISYDTPQRIVLHTDDSSLPEDATKIRHFNYWAAKGVNPNSMAEFELIGNMFDIFGVPEADRSGGPLGDNRTPILTLNPLREFDTSTIIDEKHWQHHAQDIWHLIVAYIFTPHVQDPDNGVTFAGDWVMYIGHSSAIESGIRAAFMFGARQQLEGYTDDIAPAQQCRAVADVDGTGAPESVRAACESVAATSFREMCSASTPSNAVAGDACVYNSQNSQCEYNRDVTLPFWVSDYNQNFSKACNVVGDSFAQACRSAADHLGTQHVDACEWQCTQYQSVDPYPQCPPNSELSNNMEELCIRGDSQFQEHRTQCGDHGFQANILEEKDLDFTSFAPIVNAWHGFAVWYIIVQFCVLFYIFFYISAIVCTKNEFTLPAFYGI